MYYSRIRFVNILIHTHQTNHGTQCEIDIHKKIDLHKIP